MQVSVDTMHSVYAAPSLRGPAAQLAFKLHNTVDENFSEQKQQPVPKRQKVDENETNSERHSTDAEDASVSGTLGLSASKAAAHATTA